MKCALVTGGSRGIGRAICVKMAQQGFYVLVNYKGNEAEAANTLAMVMEAGGSGEVMQFDVSNKEQVQQVLGGNPVSPEGNTGALKIPADSAQPTDTPK